MRYRRDIFLHALRVLVRDRRGLLYAVAVELGIVIRQERSVAGQPDQVVLDVFAAKIGADRVDVEQMHIGPVGNVIGDHLVELLDEEHRVAQVIARQQPAHQVLLGGHEVGDEADHRPSFVVAECALDHQRQALAGPIEQVLMAGNVVMPQGEIGELRQCRAERQHDDLKIVGVQRMRRLVRQGAGVVVEDVVDLDPRKRAAQEHHQQIRKA